MTDNNLNIWMTIPTGTRREYLADIIKESQLSPERIVIVHTVESEPIPEVHNIWDLNEINIHRWWNKGIDYAVERGAEYVAVLNDDLRLKDNPINKIASAMNKSGHSLGIPYPFTGAICGYCFVINVKDKIRPDERFRWWYGDNDLYIQAEKKNGILPVIVKIKHIEPNKLTSNSPSLMKLTEQDKIEFETKWQEYLQG